LFGDRPISKFAIELANRVLNDLCFNFIDHISPELDIRSRRLTSNEKEISHGGVSWQTGLGQPQEGAGSQPESLQLLYPRRLP
jgi:hypothetical protein